MFVINGNIQDTNARDKIVHVVVTTVWLSVAVASMLHCVAIASVLWSDEVCCSSEYVAVCCSSSLWRLYVCRVDTDIL